MADKSLKSREDIPEKYKWSIEEMYPDESRWDDDVRSCVDMAQKFLEEFSGCLTRNAETLAGALKMQDEIMEKLENACVYAHMKKDEDNRNDKYQAMENKCIGAMAQVSASMSFLVPELLEADESQILAYIDENPDLKQYAFLLKDILREKDHVLSAAEENIMAQLSEVTGASGDIFNMLNDADMNFGTVTDEDGDTVTLTHGSYTTLMESYDRNVRRQAFTNMYESYKALINTIATTYNYNTKTTVISSRIRKYDSSRQAALSDGNIPEEVYDNLIAAVHESLPALHKYMGLRKKVLEVDELKMYDVYVPLVKLPKMEIPYEEAVEIVKKGLAPLGEEYISQFQKGVDERWLDVCETPGKTSGAYSFGSYSSKPYVLLNYTDTLQDVFTVAHEMGHSMNSWYTHNTQPYVYGSHSIFTAEVASTVNETLLIRYLMDNVTDKDTKKYLINYYIEQFRTTLFRQTMFAEFELMTHREVEGGGVLTAQWLCDKYNDLNSQYYGPSLTEDEYIRYEWARIPHFYRDYYVYQYATGFSAATAIAEKILTGDPKARDSYLEFLKHGSDDYPVELLKIAGVDMSSPEPVRMAMDTFAKLVDDFEVLI